MPVAIGLSHSMYSQLKASGRSTSSLHTIQLVPLIHFSAFNTKGLPFNINSYSTLYAVRKIDENFAELSITSVGMLRYYLDVYEEEYNTRLGASKF